MVTVQYNPFTPEVQADPYPLYRQLREQDPVHWSELLDAWVLTRHKDVVSVLKDYRFSADRRRARNRFAQQAMTMQEQTGPLGSANTMLSSDPPEHTRQRNLVREAFTRRTLEAMRPHIQELTDELLDAVQDSAQMDVIQDLAYPLPVIVIAEVLGVSTEHRAQFRQWSDDIVATLGGPLVPSDVRERGATAARELADYFREVIAERRKEPRDDLLSLLIAAEEEGDVLSEQQLLATCVVLLVAGNETTRNLIGNGVLALLRHPDQLDKLQQNLSIIDSAVEEFLRYDGPVQGTARVATEEIEIGGRTIKEGQLVFTMLAAANHDPALFSDPDKLDVARRDYRHLAFGSSIHSCLGQWLARIEAQTAFATLLRRMPNPRLATDEPEWGGNFILRGLKRLPIAFDA